MQGEQQREDDDQDDRGRRALARGTASVPGAGVGGDGGLVAHEVLADGSGVAEDGAEALSAAPRRARAVRAGDVGRVRPRRPGGTTRSPWPCRRCSPRRSRGRAAPARGSRPSSIVSRAGTPSSAVAVADGRHGLGVRDAVGVVEMVVGDLQALVGIAPAGGHEGERLAVGVGGGLRSRRRAPGCRRAGTRRRHPSCRWRGRPRGPRWPPGCRRAAGWISAEEVLGPLELRVGGGELLAAGDVDDVLEVGLGAGEVLVVEEDRARAEQGRAVVGLGPE